MPMTSRSMRAAFGLAALAALGLAGCSETVGTVASSGPRVAEVEPDTTGAASGNIASLSEVIERHPTDPVAYNTRGIAYAKAGKYQSAIDDFSKAIELDPKFAGAYTNRALAFRQLGKDVPEGEHF